MTDPANPPDEVAIRHMVGRFLMWRLPDTFNPDGGISFKRTFNENTPWPMKAEPTGTNLFDATQAEAMVRHMLEGLPRPVVTADALEEARAIVARRGVGNCDRGMVDPGTGTFECRKLDRGECNCHEFDEAAEEIAALSAPAPLTAAAAFNEQARAIVEGIDADWVYDGQFAADGIRAQAVAVDAIKAALLAAESAAYARARRDSATDIAALRSALHSVVAQVNDYEWVNNLSPNPGREDCWQAVTNAKAALSQDTPLAADRGALPISETAPRNSELEPDGRSEYPRYEGSGCREGGRRDEVRAGRSERQSGALEHEDAKRDEDQAHKAVAVHLSQREAEGGE